MPSRRPRSPPAAAPETGGGGTAGLQDGLLFGIGGASVLAGLGFLACAGASPAGSPPAAPGRETRPARTR